ncbi:MAG: hypothetical protein ACRDY7_07870 [Acidimicrobiia bacterium]
MIDVLGTRKRAGRPELEIVEGGEPDEPTGPEERARMATATRLFEGVFRSAGDHLCGATEPLAAEVWASAMLAIWADGLVPGGTGDGFTGALVRHAARQRTPEGAALLLAMSAVASPDVAEEARAGAESLFCAGVPIPVWADRVGRAEATEAWIGTDVYGDQDILIIGFGYPGRGALPHGDRHTLCVLVDHNDGGRAKDAYPAADLPATLARWREAEANGITLRQCPLSEVAGRLEDALAAAAAAESDGRLLELRSLLAARLGAMPSPERAVPPGTDDESRAGLVTEFLESPEAAPLLMEPSVVDASHRLIDYRCTRESDPLRFSPTVVGRYLLDHVPATAVGSDPCDLAAIPDVLSAWVRYGARRRGLGSAAVARTLSALDACRADFSFLVAQATAGVQL